MKEEKTLEIGEDLPFDPPPIEYNYRCSLCSYECGVNEVIIDAAVMWAEIDGEYYDGFMPVLNCPNCYRQEFVSAGFKSPPEGR